MSEIILTQYNGKILGPIAKVLGWIMNGIYYVLNSLFGIENIGLCIIILTLIIYACLFPLIYKQQKFSKLSQKMNPELQAIQKKYKNKRDQVSMQKMQEETQMVYQKYGVSPTGSCIQMLIQMPILFALYRVFLNVPAYVPAVKEKFSVLVTEIMSIDGFADKMTSFVDKIKIAGLSVDFTATDTNVLHNYIVDVLYKMNTSGWSELTKVFGNLTNLDATEKSLEKLNYFLGLNISNSPWNIMTTGFKSGAYLLAIGALLIPVISFLTQRLNIKLMPTASTGENDAMAQQMKTMNLMMPLFSFVMCFTVPVGLGIYWIASALVRSIQQWGINKRLDKMDWDAIMKANQEKAKAKREKRMGLIENQIANAAKMSTKANVIESGTMTKEEKEEALEHAAEVRSNAKAGSLASKANRVREFNERNNK